MSSNRLRSVSINSSHAKSASKLPIDLSSLTSLELNELLQDQKNLLQSTSDKSKVNDCNNFIKTITKLLESKKQASSNVIRTRSSTLDSLSINSIELKQISGSNTSNNSFKLFNNSSRSLNTPEPVNPSISELKTETSGTESPTWLLSDILQNFSSKDKDDYYILAKGNDLVLLLSQNQSLKKDLQLKHLINKIQFMLYHPNPKIKSIGYRILRHSISDYESLTTLIKSKILIFVIITLSTKTTLLEKEEALKLIREFILIPQGTDNLSIGVIKCLISLIEYNNNNYDIEDPDMFSEDEDVNDPLYVGEGMVSDSFIIPEDFKKLCLETICEIALLKPELIFHSGGFKIIINTLVHAPSELAMNCLFVVQTILDSPESRKFLRNGIDLNSLIAVYSHFEDQSKDPGISQKSKPKKDKKAKKESKSTNRRLINKAFRVSFLITVFLKNWNGLICFSHDNYQVLNDLLCNLKTKNSKLRSMIMDIVFDILQIKVLPGIASSSIGDSIKKFNSILGNQKYSFSYDNINEQSFQYNIINHYIGLLIQILINQGELLLRLVEIIEDNFDEENTNKATLLFGYIADKANKLIPPQLIEKQFLMSEDNPMLSIGSLSKIEYIIRNKITPNRAITKLKQSELKHYINKINLEYKINIDDFEFKSMINNTKVLTIKEYDNWNWSLLNSFIQGPLRNPRRFDELVEKNPKFLKRLMSFFRPFKFRFCNVPTNNLKLNYKKYLNTGTNLLETLFTIENGKKYLSNNKLFSQLSEIFAQVDPYSGISAKDPILSKKRLETTLSIGYLKFIGVLASSSYGLRILEQWQFFTIFNNIIEGSADDDSNNFLIVNLFSSLDFSMDNQFRLLLPKALSISNDQVRKYAVGLLKNLIGIKECEHFVIKILVNLMYDKNSEFSKKSIDYLFQYYIEEGNLNNLNYLIELRPSIKILSNHENGKILLMNFCKTSKGFKYLQDKQYIDSTIKIAIRGHDNFNYLKLIEASLSQSSLPYFKSRDIDIHRHFLHFLLSTEEGFNYFLTHHRDYLTLLIHQIHYVTMKLRLVNGDYNTKTNGNLNKDKPDFDHHNLTLVSEDNRFNDIEELKTNDVAVATDDEEEHPDDTRAGFVDNGGDIKVSQEPFNSNDDGYYYYLNLLKQNLWILGEIASSKYGIQLLDPIYHNNMFEEMGDLNCIDLIMKLFYESPVWQIRGIAFYQLGKILATQQGIEILDELGWCSVLNDDFENPLNLSYPNNTDTADLFNIVSINPYRDIKYYTLFSGNGLGGNNEYISLQTIDDEDNDEYALVAESNEVLIDKILNYINHLTSVHGTIILARILKKAMKELNKIKQSNPQIFENISLFLKVIKIVDKGSYEFKTKNFIFDLFKDTKVLENLVKRDRKNSFLK